jgi:hypothetical protein
MMNDMSSYFLAEKMEGVIFILVGLLAMGLSLWLRMNGHRLMLMTCALAVNVFAEAGGAEYLSAFQGLTN